ncbi:hypothetical protein Glove_541g84 [Diversispora epigaea]|uniref:Uncharacterized protein n=1 Tax=Diversispora epigaea TaxID=1348612 RepID=A0A397GD10_9GLOM|nr:hypothetical protein Glove_541g84 [Diversispora epigaea]
MSNLNELFKKKKQNPSRTSSYSRASSSRPSSASASRPSSASALRPSSASASRPSLFPRPLLESEDSDLTSSSVDQMNDAVTRRIFSKLDNLKTLLEKVKKNQEDMKEEIKTIKEEVAILSHDQACIDAVIIKSAQDLLEKKIYPNYDEFKESAEFFLRESDNEFFSTLGSKWEPYFEKKIRKPLSKRLRSLRGTLCARVKTAIFENFSNMLPPISNVAKASEIAAWKKKLAVSNCFQKLEKNQENINQMKEEIDFLANINQQFGAENDQLIKNLDRFRKYRIPESISVKSSPSDSGTKSKIIPSKRPKGRKLKSKKIAKTNKEKRVFGNNSEEDTESDDEKNEKDARNEMKTIIKIINSEFSLNYDQIFTSANNCKIRRKLIPELQKSLTPKFKPLVTQLTK